MWRGGLEQCYRRLRIIKVVQVQVREYEYKSSSLDFNVSMPITKPSDEQITLIEKERRGGGGANKAFDRLRSAVRVRGTLSDTDIEIPKAKTAERNRAQELN